MAVKILHTGDGHIDSNVHGSTNPLTGINRAWEAHARALASTVRTAIENEVCLFLHAGDSFANGRPTQEAVLMFADALMPLVQARIPIVLLDGNHERLLVPTSQRTATATVGSILKGAGGEVHIVEREPRLVRLASGFQVACLPWLSKTTILSRLGEDQLSPVDGDNKVTQYALDSLEQMCDAADDAAPFIMASHVTLDDVRLDSITKGNRRGSELDITHIFAEPILPRAAVEACSISYAALSHIHARQRMGRKCFYSGSPDAFTMTDADEPKSANLVTISDDNKLEDVEHVATDARLLHQIDLNRDDAERRLDKLEPDSLVGLILAPGESIAPDSIRNQITDAGAIIVSSVPTPMERSRRNVVTLPEKTGTLDALRSWHAEKKPEGVDLDFAVSLAASMTDEVAS